MGKPGRHTRGRRTRRTLHRARRKGHRLDLQRQSPERAARDGSGFVDIGLGRNAFLYVDDINKQPLNIGDVEITQGHSGFTISEKVKRGDDVLVQIVKEPRGLKGARISTNISLPGPLSDPDADRQVLRRLAQDRVAPKNATGSRAS